jgi:hypothetical protein
MQAPQGELRTTSSPDARTVCPIRLSRCVVVQVKPFTAESVTVIENRWPQVMVERSARPALRGCTVSFAASDSCSRTALVRSSSTVAGAAL